MRIDSIFSIGIDCQEWFIQITEMDHVVGTFIPL